MHLSKNLNTRVLSAINKQSKVRVYEAKLIALYVRICNAKSKVRG